MEPQQVLHMLEQVASGSVSPVDAQRSLADQGYSDLGFAKVDTDRARRTGAGEVIYGAGKTADQIAGICLALRDAGQACVLVTRLEAQKAEAVRAALLVRDPQAAAAFEYRPVPQLGLLGAPAKPTCDSYIAVSPAVRDHMRAIYTILAEAEAAAHGCAVEQTHFHEVGDGSRIRNTLLVCLAVEDTGAKRIVATVAQTGQGEAECAHGTLSIPTPATSAIIARGIPVSERTLPGERMTSTSAAMILHFVDEFE